MAVNKSTSEESKKMTPSRKSVKRFEPYPTPEASQKANAKPKAKAKAKAKKGKEKAPDQPSSKTPTVSSKVSQRSPTNLFTLAESEVNSIFDQNKNIDTSSMSIDENDVYIHPNI